MKLTLPWLATFLLAALPLAGVAEEMNPPAAPAEITASSRQSLTFIDLKMFDSRLSQELKSGKDRVEVEMTGKVSMNTIPDRIDKWITRVGEEGNVEVREAPRTRMIFSLLPMLFSAFKASSEERLLEPAKDYNATILYRTDANGDTLIERIVFSRKKPQ